MSLQTMTGVIDRCPEQGGEYQLLLTLANRADNAGRGVWYDPERIAFEARMSNKGAVRIVERLIGTGRLSLELGAGPQGMDLLHIHLPSEKRTRATWAQQRGKKLETKRITRKAKPGPRRRSTAPKIELDSNWNPRFQQPAGSPEAIWNRGFPFLTVELGLKRNPRFLVWNPRFHQNGFFCPPGADLWAPYSSFTVHLKEVVIDITGTQARKDTAGVSPLADMLSATERDHDDHFFEDWDESDEALFGPLHTPEDLHAPYGAAPDGANQPPLDDPLWEDESVGDDENVTSTEEVPPAHLKLHAPDGAAPDGAPAATAVPFLDKSTVQGTKSVVTAPEKVPPRREKAGPGSPVYRLLMALCGGSVKNPYLPGLLGELTRGGEARTAWLTLTLGEIEDARVTAKARAAKEGVVFRTALFDALDALVDGTELNQAPAPKVRAQNVSWDQLPRPGDGDSAAQPLTFCEGQRVRLGERLGVVKFASADARQATVTVDFDDGEREIFTNQQARTVLRDAPGAPLPPAPSLVGTRWIHHDSGALLTVTRVHAGRPTTDDGTTWPAYGAGALMRCASPAPSQATEGAA